MCAHYCEAPVCTTLQMADKIFARVANASEAKFSDCLFQVIGSLFESMLCGSNASLGVLNGIRKTEQCKAI